VRFLVTRRPGKNEWPSPPSLAAGAPRVLVVDDERDVADSLALLLTRRGFEVTQAYDTKSALDTAARFRPTVVITDLRLGGVSGVDLARSLRERAPGTVRVIAATGRAPEEIGADVACFDGFVLKPVDLDALLPLIGGL